MALSKKSTIDRKQLATLPDLFAYSIFERQLR